jgi:hypothetical protein
LGFLEVGRFAAKSPGDGYWILLDFLGFSRPNRDFSMGYAGFSRENFSRALSADREPGEWTRSGRGHAEYGSFHTASLVHFLIFVNRLLPLGNRQKKWRPDNFAIQSKQFSRQYPYNARLESNAVGGRRRKP